MITISFANGSITEVKCDTAAEAAGVVSSMEKAPPAEKVAPPSVTPPKVRAVRRGKYNSWLAEEVKILVAGVHAGVAPTKNATLRARHSSSAISTAASSVRTKKFLSPRFEEHYHVAMKETATA